jgi:hypothetical protein
MVTLQSGIIARTIRQELQGVCSPSGAGTKVRFLANIL